MKRFLYAIGFGIILVLVWLGMDWLFDHILNVGDYIKVGAAAAAGYWSGSGK